MTVIWMLRAVLGAVTLVVVVDRLVNGAWVWWTLRDWWRTR
jgi:hypothetical protein